jgi:ribosomal-protein-alanine N-acetyltransferase
VVQIVVRRRGQTIVATVPSVADVLLPSSWSLGEFRLRPLRLGDAPAWLAYLSDPRVIEHTSFPEFDLSAVEAMLSRQLEGYAAGTSCRWAIADVTDGLIGTCGFSNWSLPHAHAELVYDLAPAFWGRGLMRAAAHQVLSWAFNTARFNRVHAFVITSNAPSIRLLEALGFVREGTLQQYRIARGAARDFHVYAQLQAAAGNAVGAA